MRSLFKDRGLVMMLIMLLCSIFGVVDAGVLGAEVVAAPGGGAIAPGEIASTQFTRENSEDLLLNDIERRVVKIRPMGNPLEQLARYATKRSSRSQIHEYYSTDTLPSSAKIKTAFVEGAGFNQFAIDSTNNAIFSKYETIIVPSVKGFNEAFVETDHYLVLYILDKTEDGKLVVTPVNGKKIGDNENCIPELPLDTVLIRAGRAHNEVDMQTSTYACVPTKRRQLLQRFRTQIEETTLQKISDKEADWNFNDTEEEAVFDMKRGMNKAFWLGSKRIIMDKAGKEVFFTEGIWWQAGKEFAYGKDAANVQFDEEMLVDLTKKAFTGNAGNKRKVFLMGSGLMANISKIKRDRVMVGKNTITKYGIEFEEIKTNFGCLWCVHDESLDEMGMADKGLIFDADYLRKVSIDELSAKDLDMRGSGTRDVDARTISETSSLVLQNPEAHMKVVPIA